MKTEIDNHWWKGGRGEWYVVVQVALIALVFVGPRTYAGWPDVPFPFARFSQVVGGILMIVGGLLSVAGLLSLGKRLTSLPYPKENTSLVETGPYGLVRHPIYSGGILLAFGWALITRGWLTLISVFVLFIFFDIKSRREEQWLVERFPAYRDYQRRVRKLVPFIY